MSCILSAQAYVPRHSTRQDGLGWSGGVTRMGSKPSKELGPGKIGRHVPHGVMLVAGDMLGRKGEIMCVRSTQSHDEEVRES